MSLEKSPRRRSTPLQRKIIGGAGVLGIGPMLFFLFHLPGVDWTMVRILIVFFFHSLGVLISAFVPSKTEPKKEECA